MHGMMQHAARAAARSARPMPDRPTSSPAVPVAARRAPAPALAPAQRRRLRELWRSAGWPSQDLVEVELLAAGLVERVRDAAGRETLRVTDAGVQALAATLAHNRGTRSLHERLVERVAREMQRAGRIVWRGLALRAPLAEAPPAVRWVQAIPDVYSIRHTTREDLALPLVHEVKVRRADLLADLRQPDKRAAYLALASQCWYVLKAGIAEPEEIPGECGVIVAHPGPGEHASDASGASDAMLADAGTDPFGGRLEVLRPAPVRAHRIDFATWVALARASALPPPEEPAQAPLREA
jgi:hypothetical protein